MSVAGRYLVHLPQFEGPLALLLYLIRKEEMDIFNININSITREYLEHIRMMKELDLELAGDFVAMAATLIQIKARMLLPQYNDEGEVVEVEDPRKELVQKLLDYQLYQDAAKKLYERPLLNRDVWGRALPKGWRDELWSGEGEDVVIEDEGLFGLIASYRRAMKKAERLVHKVRPKTQSIAGRVLEIKDRLTIGAKVLLRDLLNIGEHSTRNQLLITFLSMLEMGRLGFVSIFQNETYGDIHIELKKQIDRNILERVQEFDSADAESVANSIIGNAMDDAATYAETSGSAVMEKVSLADENEAGQMGLEILTETGDAILPEALEGMSLETVDDLTDGRVIEAVTDDELEAAEKELGLSADDIGQGNEPEPTMGA